MIRHGKALLPGPGFLILRHGILLNDQRRPSCLPATKFRQAPQPRQIAVGGRFIPAITERQRLAKEVQRPIRPHAATRLGNLFGDQGIDTGGGVERHARGIGLHTPVNLLARLLALTPVGEHVGAAAARRNKRRVGPQRQAEKEQGPLRVSGLALLEHRATVQGPRVALLLLQDRGEGVVRLLRQALGDGKTIAQEEIDIGLACQARGEGGVRLGVPAKRLQGNAAAGVDDRLVAAASQRRVEVCQRLGRLLHLQVKEAAIDIGLEKSGVARQTGRVVFQCFDVPAEVLRDAPAVPVAPGKFRPQVHAGAVSAVSHLLLALLGQASSHKEQGPVMPRIETQRLLEFRDRFAGATLAGIGRGQQVVIAGAGRSQGAGPAPRCGRFRTLAELVQVRRPVLPQGG